MQGRNSDDGVWTVTKEEFVEFYEVFAYMVSRDLYLGKSKTTIYLELSALDMAPFCLILTVSLQVKSMLKDLLMTQITTFRNSFPFGRPDGALKTTILLLEQVLTNKIELQVDCCDLEG